ncbi:MAG: uroporphyrinogen decarboxylase family protein [Actinomycetota bacterium]
MTGVERISNILQRKPVDRIGVFEHFWYDTHQAWAQQGRLGEHELLPDHFGLDMDICWPFNTVARVDFAPEVIEETEETVLTRDGNGALLRRHKLHSATFEHVGFLVKDRAGWEGHIKPHLKAERRRIHFEGYRWARQYARDKSRFFAWCGTNVFECIHPVCGHENLLFGMADDPDWVRDMTDTYAQLLLDLQEMLFAEEGYPDGIWYYEDMGYRGNPFMSPKMYKALIQPAHAKTIDFAHAHGVPVIMHSCGFVEPLVPHLVEIGLDCLQVIEVKAGMDPLKLHRKFGDRLSLMGGIDVRVLYNNDRAEIDAELEAKIPILKQGFGYVLHSDHSIPFNVEHDTYKYFVEKGLELGTYA